MPSVLVNSDNDDVFEKVSMVISNARRIIVVTGAGISTNCNIPDFRSRGGLYNRTVACAARDLSQADTATERWTNVADRIPPSQLATKTIDLFQTSIVHQDRSSAVAFNILAVLLRKRAQSCEPSVQGSHAFIRELRDRGRLLRCYTQNIDSLEKQNGLTTGIRIDYETAVTAAEHQHTGTTTEVVNLHGDISTVRCRVCSAVYPWLEDYDDIFLQWEEPGCLACGQFAAKRAHNQKRKTTVGSLRPNIVLYGENHPQQSMIDELIDKDKRSQPDLLLVMGTSLSCHGIRQLVKDLARVVHQQRGGQVLCINRAPEIVRGFSGIIDVFVNMDCDNWVKGIRIRLSEQPPLSQIAKQKYNASLSNNRKVSREEENQEAELWLEGFF